MKPVDQLIVPTHPNLPPYGDCFRACIASLLELPALEVPHFFDYADGDADRGFRAANDWLEPRGLGYVDMPVSAGDLPSFAGLMLRGYHVLSGESGLSVHAVVAHRGHPVHDPHPARPGVRPMVLGPGAEGYLVGVLYLLHL